jgi:hypothetical protein
LIEIKKETRLGTGPDDKQDSATREMLATCLPKCHLLWDSITAKAIGRFAKRRRCALIGMGSHGKGGMRRVLLGSIARAVIACSPVPVVVVRERQAGGRKAKGEERTPADTGTLRRRGGPM